MAYYKIAIISLSTVFVGSSISIVILGLLEREIQELHISLAMSSMATLSALIVSPPKY
jgi:hypothetical protein